MKRLLICLLLFVNLLSCKAQDYIDWVSPVGGYGALYNWYAASNANFAPVGWHVPSITELNTLCTNLGGSLSYGYPTQPNIIGSMLKEIGNVHWTNGTNSDATNSSGFSGTAGGRRNYTDGNFSSFGSQMYIGTTSTSGTSFVLTGTTTTFSVAFRGKNDGSSYRFIKDDSTDPGTLTDYDGNVYPTVKIGNQVWTASNWKCEHLNDGTAIPNVTDNSTWAALTTMGMCYYNNDIKNK